MDKYGTGQDPYCYPGTQVLRNTLNLTDPDELALAERELTAARQDGIEFEPPPYDFAFLKRLHRCLFQVIYEWAGKTRTIDLPPFKGDNSILHCRSHRAGSREIISMSATSLTQPHRRAFNRARLTRHLGQKHAAQLR